MIIRLENIAQYVGQMVTIEGWLYDKTDKGKLQFLAGPRRQRHRAGCPLQEGCLARSLRAGQA
jgi:hypothetical protein